MTVSEFRGKNIFRFRAVNKDNYMLEHPEDVEDREGEFTFKVRGQSAGNYL